MIHFQGLAGSLFPGEARCLRQPSLAHLDAQRVGAAPALQVFKEGFLDNSWSYTMGLAKVPLVSLYDAAGEVLETDLLRPVLAGQRFGDASLLPELKEGWDAWRESH